MPPSHYALLLKKRNVEDAIQKSTNSIRKATRTLPAWKKDAASVATEAAKIPTSRKRDIPKDPSEARRSR